MFAVPFGQHGPTHLSTYLTSFKVGDLVDVKASGKIHKGMPHKYYHGKTGRIWNVTPRAVGVEINKQVKQRIIKKKIHVRIEHVQKSTCREDFLRRRKENDTKRREAAAKKQSVQLKRQPALPRAAGFELKVAVADTQLVKAARFEEIY
jgi:large subunit ribosomal protein L21e